MPLGVHHRFGLGFLRFGCSICDFLRLLTFLRLLLGVWALGRRGGLDYWPFDRIDIHSELPIRCLVILRVRPVEYNYKFVWHGSAGLGIELQPRQARVDATQCDQLSVGSLFDQFAVVQDHDAVRFLNRRQAVRNDQGSSVLHG